MRKTVRSASALLLAVLLAMSCLAAPALAATPERPANKYVLDNADVISDETEKEIIRENGTLFEQTGAEIVIVAVDFLDGKAIDDYAYDLFNVWGIGSAERNNGLLLVMSVAEDDYYALPGYGIEDHFTGSKLQDILDEKVEPWFAQGDYDRAAKGFFDEALKELKSYRYNDDYDALTDPDFYEGGSYEDFSDYSNYYSSGFWLRDLIGRFFRTAVRVVLIVAVVLIVIAVLRGMSGGGGGGTGTGGGGGSRFWRGMFLGSLLSGSRRRSGWYRSPPPPPGGFGGFGGFGGPSGRFGGSSGGFRSGGSSHRGGGGGGFHGGGASRGGGAGRH